MWDFFNTESNTEATTNSAGSGFQDVSDLNSVNLSGLEIYKSADVDLQFYQTDHGAVGAGIETAQGSVNAIADVTKDAIDLVSDEAEGNRYLVGGFVNKVIERESGILAAALGEIENNRIYTAGLIQESNAAITSSVNATLLFADDQSRRVQETTFRALESVERSTDNAFAFVGQGYSKFVDAAKEVIKGINVQAGKNIQTVSDATRSDAANSLDKVVETAGLAFLGLAVAAVVIGKS